MAGTRIVTIERWCIEINIILVFCELVLNMKINLFKVGRVLYVCLLNTNTNNL